MARESGFDRHSSQVPDINRGLIPARPLVASTRRRWPEVAEVAEEERAGRNEDTDVTPYWFTVIKHSDTATAMILLAKLWVQYCGRRTSGEQGARWG